MDKLPSPRLGPRPVEMERFESPTGGEPFLEFRETGVDRLVMICALPMRSDEPDGHFNSPLTFEIDAKLMPSGSRGFYLTVIIGRTRALSFLVHGGAKWVALLADALRGLISMYAEVPFPVAVRWTKAARRFRALVIPEPRKE